MREDDFAVVADTKDTCEGTSYNGMLKGEDSLLKTVKAIVKAVNVVVKTVNTVVKINDAVAKVSDLIQQIAVALMNKGNKAVAKVVDVAGELGSKAVAEGIEAVKDTVNVVINIYLVGGIISIDGGAEVGDEHALGTVVDTKDIAKILSFGGEETEVVVELAQIGRVVEDAVPINRADVSEEAENGFFHG